MIHFEKHIPPDTKDFGLLQFNRCVLWYNGQHSLLFTRLSALHKMMGVKGALSALAQHFRRLYSHWPLNGDPYRVCKYVVQRLSSSEVELYRNPWGDKYLRVIVHADMEKKAVVKAPKRKRLPCRIHPHVLGSSQGWCYNNCQRRMRKLEVRGIKLKDIPEETVVKILSFPVRQGRGAGADFINHAESVMFDYMRGRRRN